MEVNDLLGIVAIVGEEGSGKSSMALSFPRKIFHFDIDVGGFKRAAWRLPEETRIKTLSTHEKLEPSIFTDFDIISKAYPRPIQVDKLLGLLTDKTSSRTIQVQFPKKVEGIKELWQVIVTDFVIVCQIPEVSSIIFDTSTLLWNIAHNTVLQEAQERQLYRWQQDSVHKNQKFDENEYRERLGEMEYGPANERITQLLHTARAFSKNLVLTHYPRDAYGMVADGKGGMEKGRTGEKELDGFKHTGKLADIIVWTSIKEDIVKGENGKPMKVKYPIAKFAKAGVEGMGLSAVGMEVPASFEGICNLRNLLRGVK